MARRPELIHRHLLAAAVVIGSGLLWLAIPVAGFLLAGRITENATHSVLIALVVAPLAMIGFGWLLGRVNAQYEALDDRRGGPRGPPAWRASLGEERRSAQRRRGGRPLMEVAMTVSAITAMVALLVWFFVFAELRLGPMQ